MLISCFFLLACRFLCFSSDFVVSVVLLFLVFHFLCSLSLPALVLLSISSSDVKLSTHPANIFQVVVDDDLVGVLDFNISANTFVNEASGVEPVNVILNDSLALH
jgi:hypothetical protein